MQAFALLFSIILLAAPAWVAGRQGTSNRDHQQAQQQVKTGPVSVQGCLTGAEGRYTVATRTDKLYLLAGNQAEFKHYNGKLVRIRGVQKPPSLDQPPMGVLKYPPARLEVAKITKIADTCG